MPYTTVADVRVASGLTDATLITNGTVQTAIDGATGLIDGKIGDRYLLPLASTPTLIAFLAKQMATAILLMDEYSEEAKDTDKGWEKRLKFFLDQLDDIRDGKTRLAVAGVELERISLGGPSFYPTAASSQPDAVDSTQPRFTVNRRF